MGKIKYWAGLFIFLGMTLPVFPREPVVFHLQFDTHPRHSPTALWRPLAHKKIGLALSGGGARGLAHIGVLQVLEENHIPVDAIAGTSIGAIVGGLYASGFSAKEIWKIARRIHWQTILVDKPKRTSLFLSTKQLSDRYFVSLYFDGFRPVIPTAVSPGQRLYDELAAVILRAPYHVIHSFDDLKYPFRAIATDVLHGRKIVFNRGNLGLAMQASATIPLLFQPVDLDSLLLVDGGVVENIPVSDVKKLGADFVIAVDVTSPLRQRKNIRAPWELADQVTTIMQFDQRKRELAQADVVVRPDLGLRTNTDFSKPEQAYRAGVEAAWKAMPQIRRMLLQKPRPSENRVFTVRKVETTQSFPSDARFIPFGQRLWTGFEIRQLIERIYRQGIWKNVWAEITGSPSAQVLVIHRVPNPVLSRVIFEGNHLLADSLLLKRVKFRFQQPVNWRQWEKNCEAIVRFYRKKQLSLAYIYSVRFDTLAHTLTLGIREGKIDRISIEGNRHTRNWVILREFPMRAGDVFSADKIQQGLINIYSLGFFKRVFLEYRWEGAFVHLIIHVSEKPHIQVSQSYRYDRDRRLKLLIEGTYQNVLGMGGRLALSQIVGKRDLSTRLSFQNDRLFKTYLTTTLDFHYTKIKHYVFRKGNIAGEYQERRTGFNYAFGRQVKRLGTTSLSLHINEIALRQVFGGGYPIIKIREAGLRLETILDALDQMPFPKHGRYYHFYYEVFGQLLGNDIAFSKLYTSVESYYTYFRRLTVHPRFLWGTADRVTPFQEMFRFGGENSFYGFREDEIRARRFLIGSLGLRYALPLKLPSSTLYFHFRGDWGAFWKNSLATIEGKDFTLGGGGGLSLETLLGNFSFQYGVNSRGRKNYYFSAGFRF